MDSRLIKSSWMTYAIAYHRPIKLPIADVQVNITYTKQLIRKYEIVLTMCSETKISKKSPKRSDESGKIHRYLPVYKYKGLPSQFGRIYSYPTHQE